MSAQYGRLLFVEEAGVYVTPKGKEMKRWLMLCECGKKVVKLATNVRAGRTTTCGAHGRGRNTERLGIVAYSSVHNRLNKRRGRAGLYRCQDGCGRMATQWSYDHQDPDELLNERGWPYSMNLERYQPRCKSCHSLLDHSYKVGA